MCPSCKVKREAVSYDMLLAITCYGNHNNFAKFSHLRDHSEDWFDLGSLEVR